MSGQTSPWNLRYPLYTESTDAATQIQNLANDINTALGTVTTSVNNAVSKKRAQITRTVNQSIPNAVFTNFTFVSEQFDNDNMANLGVDNAALTVVTAGLYWLGARSNWNPNTTGDRAIRFTVNGLVPVTQRDETNATGTETTNQSMSALIYCNVADVIRLQGFQSSGGALNNGLAELSAVRMTG